ncbi:hypothetical protein Y1Q_0011783 [Alligator mississippiensis]|uniref:Uncharacterized protein n=1 Tax=Alligator mississippiensis TaxID=8496 RepID=A0A151M193_ALLMI|nr:hypothetical protein Y1Q_0011783 [Alligator mississippiensis]
MTVLMQLVPLRRDDMLQCDVLNVSQVALRGGTAGILPSVLAALQSPWRRLQSPLGRNLFLLYTLQFSVCNTKFTSLDEVENENPNFWKFHLAKTNGKSWTYAVHIIQNESHADRSKCQLIFTTSLQDARAGF